MRHFVAVAEELHFGRAARRLHMAQPPLSQSIRRLELDLGVDLFDRSRRGVELTAAGKVFLTEARRTLAQADLTRKLTQREAMQVPEIRVSFVGAALYRILPDMIARYRTTRPDVHIRLFERSSVDQIAGLKAGDFDIGFVTVAGAGGLDFCETLVVERTRSVAAIPADWPVAQQSSITPIELSELPFIAPPQRYAQSSALYTAFSNAGVMPHVTQETMQTNTAISLVSAGLGVSMVPATASLMQPRNVRFMPISGLEPEPASELTMMWHPQQVGARGEEFVAFTRQFLAEKPHLLDPDAPL
ncbi:LysR substrate-binding domain-containing protein [Sphingobium tyrosinilyticum]|uniref:LysR substrate-binding domain-containing protein n=1 Tax=Sphingobium tyrosinilyticum TaxID=2715436 RepID=A0ABV9F4V0_9SPHN